MASRTAVHEHGDGHARFVLLSAECSTSVSRYPLQSQAPNRNYHNRSCYEPLYGTIRQLESRVVIGDIGSHTMDPHRTLDGCLCYGSSVAVAAGAAAAAPEKRVICVTGDGGFSHSGRAGLAEALDRKVTLVVFVIDNGGCQDTGGQFVSVDWPDAGPGLRVEKWPLSNDCPLPLDRLQSWFESGGVTLVRTEVPAVLASLPVP
jgi:hypothetical protein